VPFWYTVHSPKEGAIVEQIGGSSARPSMINGAVLAEYMRSAFPRIPLFCLFGLLDGADYQPIPAGAGRGGLICG
jgi:hypothetical protein